MKITDSILEENADQTIQTQCFRRNWRLGLGQGAGAFAGERKKTAGRKPATLGLYAPAAGAPDALKWSPDASGAHRS